jgi:hypothetical protein
MVGHTLTNFMVTSIPTNFIVFVVVFITYNGIVSSDRLKILIEKRFKLNNKHHIDSLSFVILFWKSYHHNTSSCFPLLSIVFLPIMVLIMPFP